MGHVTPLLHDTRYYGDGISLGSRRTSNNPPRPYSRRSRIRPSTRGTTPRCRAETSREREADPHQRLGGMRRSVEAGKD